MYDHFDFWLNDPVFGRDMKIYEELESELAEELLQPIFKAKNVDSNTSQHSLIEEEKARDFETQLSESLQESVFKNVNNARRRTHAHLLMDSEYQVDELVSTAHIHD